MYRQNVILAAAALFAIGVAFAAQPTSSRADRFSQDATARPPWTPGTDALMSTHEPDFPALAPPR